MHKRQEKKEMVRIGKYIVNIIEENQPSPEAIRNTNLIVNVKTLPLVDVIFI